MTVPVTVQIDIQLLGQVLDLLEEALQPKVTFTGDLPDMKQQAEERRIELIKAAQEGLYTIPGQKVRPEIEERRQRQ